METDQCHGCCCVAGRSAQRRLGYTSAVTGLSLIQPWVLVGTFLPSPAQSPRIPIWVGGYWPNKRPLRRAARFDGVCPGKVNSDGTPGELTPTDVQNLKQYISSQRTSDAPFDIVIGGQTSGDDPEQAGMLVSSFARAGATWWLESAGAWPDMVSLDSMRARIRQGPPHIDDSHIQQG